jgi:cyclin-dependent kinase 8/11
MSTLREIKLLRELRHENIVNLEDIHLDPIERSLGLVFEYAEHDLRQLIQHAQRFGPRMPQFTIKSIACQILKGMNYLHDNWIIHRDMKPQNILVISAGPARGRVQIADFGLARFFQAPVKSLSEVERVVVTLWYRAPELLLGAKHYTKAVDVWAIGCILAELFLMKVLLI